MRARYNKVKGYSGDYMDLEAIRQQLMRQPCPMHDIYPEVYIWRETVRFRCCCEPFRRELSRRLESLHYQAIQEDMRLELDRILRGE